MEKISFFNQTSKQVHSSSVRVVRIFFFIEKPVQQKTISCDVIFFYLCSRLNCLCIMGHSFILYLVNHVFSTERFLCALYIKRLNLWCHLYDNSASLVINGRKSFFLYICVCFVCISHTYHASFYTLHITWTLQSCACCFLMQFFFFTEIQFKQVVLFIST